MEELFMGITPDRKRQIAKGVKNYIKTLYLSSHNPILSAKKLFDFLESFSPEEKTFVEMVISIEFMEQKNEDSFN